MRAIQRSNYLPGGVIRYLMPDELKKADVKVTADVDMKNIQQKGVMRIILADDDIDDREMFTEVIDEIAGGVVLELAEDGNQLLSLLQAKDKPLPQLIFLDLNMPNKSGRECLELIRSNERLKHIPVIIYSTSSSIKDMDETFEKGANLYLRKSSSFTDLVNTTRRVLSLNWNKYKPNASRTEYVFSPKTN